MSKFFSALAVLGLTISPFPALADPAPTAAAPTALDAQVRCAALFALVAGQQARREPGADRFPPLDQAGRTFFVRTGMRLVTERKIPVEAVEPLFKAKVGELSAAFAAAADPAAAREAAMGECLPLLMTDTASK